MFVVVVLMLPACSDDEPMGKGDVDFEITDAPIDDASIKGVFVTVSDIKVDGQSISGFTKQTIDLKAYQEGKTTLLGTSHLNAKTYSTITLVLDLNLDDQGNAPGCFVLTNDNAKFKLRESSTGVEQITISKNLSVVANNRTKIVLDFDLRKSIRYVEDQSIRYSFVTSENLKTSVRVIVKEKTGTISGTYTEQQNTNAYHIVVYAYKKGTFNESTEVQGDEQDHIQFKNAVTSALVKGNIGARTYLLALMEEGDYELHFVAYSNDTQSGRIMFTNVLQSQTSLNGSVGNYFTIHAGANLALSSSISGSI
jgi:hypothetical protein